MMKKGDDKKAKDAQPSEQQPEEKPKLRMSSVLHLPSRAHEWKNAACCGGVTFIVLAVAVVVLSAADVIVTAVAASTERVVDRSGIGRFASMIVLIVSSLAAVAMAIYGITGVAYKNTKPLHTTAVALVILAIIQAIITGVSVHVSHATELAIEKNVATSFMKAKNGDPSHVAVWDTLESGMECCGLYGPDDFRDPSSPLPVPPDVPASCCPYYKNNPNKTDENQRTMCKINRTYYQSGCKNKILTVIKGLSITVVAVTIITIVGELLLAILGLVLSRKRQHEKHHHIDIIIRDPKLHQHDADPTK